MAVYGMRVGWLLAGIAAIAMVQAGCRMAEPKAAMYEKPVSLNLSPYYYSRVGWSDPNSKSDFKAFGGWHDIDGLPFNIDGMVVLYGQSWARGRSTEPNDVIGIKVGRKFDELHLVHMAGWPDVEGTTIAIIRLNYHGGSKAELPIIYGGHVRDWNRTAAEESETLSDKNSKICWRGTQQGNKYPRLFRSMLANPHPDRVVTTIDAVSTRSLSSYRLSAATIASHDSSRPVTLPVPAEPDRQFKGRVTLRITDAATGKPLEGVLVQTTLALVANQPEASGKPQYSSRKGEVTIRYPVDKYHGGSATLTKAGYCTISQRGADTPPETVDITMEKRDPEGLYATYDKNLNGYLATAVKAVGKETIKFEPLSDRYTVPKKVTLNGTQYDIGLTIGYIAKQAGAKLPMVEQKNRKVNDQVAELYKRIYPEYLEMVRGIAEVYGARSGDIDLRLLDHQFIAGTWCGVLKYESFFSQTDFGNYGYPIPGVAHSCSVASYYVDGRQLVGRNFDNPSDRPHYLTVTEMPGCYKVIGHTIYDIGTWVTDGINEKGLSLCGATNGGKYYLQEPYPDEPAIFLGQMQRIVMDKCATVDEAIALIGTVRVWCPNEGIHWLIADASGRSVVVEWDLNHKMVVFDRKEPWELMTNSALQLGEPNVIRECWRYRKAKPQLEAGVHDAAEMLEIMKGIRSNTLWTSVMDLKARTIEVHYFKEFDKKYEFGF